MRGVRRRAHAQGRPQAAERLQQPRRLLHRHAAALVQVVPLRAHKCAVQRAAQRLNGDGPAAGFDGGAQLLQRRGREFILAQLRAQRGGARLWQRREQLRQLHAPPSARLLWREALRRRQQRQRQAQRQRARGVAARARAPRWQRGPEVRCQRGRGAQLRAHERVKRVAGGQLAVRQRMSGGVQLESGVGKLVVQVCAQPLRVSVRAGLPARCSTHQPAADRTPAPAAVAPRYPLAPQPRSPRRTKT